MIRMFQVRMAADAPSPRRLPVSRRIRDGRTFQRARAEGRRVIEHEAHAGRIGREAYTYGHIPIVAGMIVLAVADEMVLEHPTGKLEAFFVATWVGGAFLFVGGNALFKRITNSRGIWPLSQ